MRLHRSMNAVLASGALALTLGCGDGTGRYDGVAQVGAAGPRGFEGERGAKGPDGPRGPAGPAGKNGPDGPPGMAGGDGPVGPSGADGPVGPAGANGPRGEVGPRGLTGTDGPTGPAGANGPQGPAGVQGAPGAAGPLGDVGPVGPQGPAGPLGAQGPQGDIGITGPQGVTGPTGPAGQDGGVGAIGVPGPEGPKGETGATGPIGPDGLAGANGVSCWDLDADGQADAAEDTNRDGVVGVGDCSGAPPVCHSDEEARRVGDGWVCATRPLVPTPDEVVWLDELDEGFSGRWNVSGAAAASTSPDLPGYTTISLSPFSSFEALSPLAGRNLYARDGRSSLELSAAGFPAVQDFSLGFYHFGLFAGVERTRAGWNLRCIDANGNDERTNIASAPQRSMRVIVDPSTTPPALIAEFDGIEVARVPGCGATFVPRNLSLYVFAATDEPVPFHVDHIAWRTPRRDRE